MEINLKQLSTQATEATTGTRKMRLSENATSMVFQLFTKNIYSNPIGTVVREITSNCFDSHIEAKVNSPVLIRKSKDSQSDTLYISFIDYGVGMSPDRVENIYGVYFESTKRCDNTQIGGFGIGGKTPLAYKRSTGHGEGEYDNGFFVITIFEGTKYFYYIYEGQEAPEISLLHSEPTTEHNGTEVRVPVLEKDVPTFEKEMVRQLYYFENVIFEGFDRQTLSNEYKIVRGKNFLFRGIEHSDNIHVCLGRVAYPIDYNVLGLSSYDYRLPVAVRLEVGEINVVASREQLDYNESTIKVLKAKLEAVKKEIKDMVVKQYANIVTLEDYFKVKKNFGILEFPNGITINTGKIIEMKDVDFSAFKYGFLKMPSDNTLFKFFFDIKTYGKKTRRNRYSSSNNDNEFNGGYDELKSNTNLLYIEEEFNRKVLKQAYLKETHGMYHVIGRRNLCDSWMRAEIAEVFHASVEKSVDENGKPVKYVQSLIDMQEEYFAIVRKHAEDYDKVEIPEGFIESRKNKRAIAKQIRGISIPVKFMGRHGKSTVKLDNLFKYKMPIFYGTQEDEYALNNARHMFDALFDSDTPVSYFSDHEHRFVNGHDRNSKNNKKSIMFIMLAKANVKYMEYCNKAYPVSEFFRRMLYRKEEMVQTYFQTYDIISDWNGIGSIFRCKNFRKIDLKWGMKISKVNKYMSAINAGDGSIGHYKTELGRYFDLANVKKTDAQIEIAKLIEEIKGLENNNTGILEYIRMSYHDDLENDILIEILKKVMAL